MKDEPTIAGGGNQKAATSAEQIQKGAHSPAVEGDNREKQN